MSAVDAQGPSVGFHEGELAVQRRAGVGAAAARLGGMLDPADLTGGIGRFLADRNFAAMSARGRDGRLWISPLVGPAGFLHATGPAELRIGTVPPPGDPLHGLAAGQAVGLIAVEFARRRRARINGTLDTVDGRSMTVRVDQAYGNCPQYIHQRVLEPAPPAASDAAPVRVATALSDADTDLVRAADTVLLGTTHPERGNDASHRGGPAGFVRIDGDGRLWLPDYPGNNMFNSLGNIAVDPSTALLFVDFTTGATLQLTGTAELVFDTTVVDDAGTGRALRFTVDGVVAAASLPLRQAG